MSFEKPDVEIKHTLSTNIFNSPKRIKKKSDDSDVPFEYSPETNLNKNILDFCDFKNKLEDISEEKFVRITNENYKLDEKEMKTVKTNIKNKTDFDYDFILNNIDRGLIQEKLLSMNIDFSLQQNITSKMFSVLLDWLIDVNEKFKCSMEVLYLTHQIICRYLTKVANVKRSKLQLIGVTAFFMSTKYEEIYPPEIKELVYVTDKAYTKDEIIAMEWQMLSLFDFNLLYTPTIYTFSGYFSFFCCHDRYLATCVCYLQEMSLLYTNFLQFSMSKIVVSAIVIARAFCKRHIIKKEITFCSGYVLEDLYDCIKTFYTIFSDKTKLKISDEKNAVQRKYQNSKYQNVSSNFETYDFADFKTFF